MASGPYISVPVHMGANAVFVSFLPVAAVSSLSGPKSMCLLKGMVTSTTSDVLHWRAGIVT